MDIIKEENKVIASPKSDTVETPKELYNLLNDYVVGQDDAKEFYLLPFTITTKELTMLQIV